MSSFHPINPKPFLKTLVGTRVVVRLKWNKTEYEGTLLSIDNYMNLQLESAVERADGEEAEVGELFIRCNNVLFVRGKQQEAPPATEASARADTEMQ
ncbi:Sm domain-containing protein [[Candida] zeylanoides]